MVSAGVVIPVKAFAVAKGRLGDVLTPEERASLARSLAEVVVRAAHPLPVFVVTDDAEVRDWAQSHGAAIVADPRGGLDTAVTAGVEHVASRGLERVIVAHGDLPLATDLAWVAEFAGITLLPDRHGDGTNVIGLPAASGFRFAYGVGSFRRHLAEARRIGLPLRIVRDPALATDVDTPDDLATLDAMTESRNSGGSRIVGRQ